MPTAPDILNQVLARTPVADFDLAVIATTWDGRVGYWNRAAERLYGWSTDEVRGRNIVEVTPAQVAGGAASAIMGQLQSGQPWEGRMKLRKRDGTEFSAFVIDTPLPADKPDLCAIIGASGPEKDQDRVRERNALLRAELKLHLGDLWTTPEPTPESAPRAAPEGVEGLTYYRCYFRRDEGPIRAVLDGHFTSDTEALTFARKNLAVRKSETMVEVWDGGRMLRSLRRS